MELEAFPGVSHQGVPGVSQLASATPRIPDALMLAGTGRSAGFPGVLKSSGEVRIIFASLAQRVQDTKFAMVNNL